jgi:hypothetical protein
MRWKCQALAKRRTPAELLLGAASSGLRSPEPPATLAGA